MISSKIKIIGIAFLLAGAMFASAERVSAYCCKDNCPWPDNNVCCSPPSEICDAPTPPGPTPDLWMCFAAGNRFRMMEMDKL